MSSFPTWRTGRRTAACGVVDLHSRRNVAAILSAGTILTSFLLISQFHLAHPNDHPLGNPTNLGHQAFAPTFHSTVASSSPTTPTDDGDALWELPPGFGDGASWDPYATTGGWNPSVLATAPLTEITIKACVLPPGIFGDLCMPTSTPKEDATRGKWTRVEKDVNRRIGVYFLYLFERRLLPNSQSSVITNITFLTERPQPGDLTGNGLWVEVSEGLRTGVWPRMPSMFLHYRLNEQADIMAARRDNGGHAGDLEPITELDVLYGGDAVQAPWGWLKTPLITGGSDDKAAAKKGSRPGSALAVRKAIKPLPPKPTLQFSSAGRFKILQVADLHFSVGTGDCRDMDATRIEECKAVGGDLYSLQWLETALDEIEPDLVVLSGDQLNGQDTSWDSQSVILKWAPLLWQRDIPWTVIFGNHDEEVGSTDAEQMAMMRGMPYFLGEEGPAGVDGVGNYVRSIQSFDSSNTTLFNLYFLDSHAYAKSLNPFDKGYDWLKPNQINWFKAQSAKVKPFLRPYTPRRTPRPATNRPPTRPSTNRLPTKPQQAAPAQFADEDDLRRAIKRQGDVDLEALEEDLEAADRLSTGVMPDDGSHVKDVPDDPFKDLDVFDEPVSAAASAAPYDAPGGNDFAEPLRATVLAVGPTKARPLVAKPNAITFFHIPLPESYDAPIDIGRDGKRLLYGERLEGKGSAKFNSGFFDEALVLQGEIVGEPETHVDEFFEGEFSAPATRPPSRTKQQQG